MKYLKYDFEDDENYPDTFSSEQEVIEDANRYYHEHFIMDEDYNENFEIVSFKQSIDFWEANGYFIYKKLDC